MPSPEVREKIREVSGATRVEPLGRDREGEGFFFDGCSPSRSRRPQLTPPVPPPLKRALEPDLRPHPRKGAPGRRHQDRRRTGFVSDGTSEDNLVRYGSAVKWPSPWLNTEVSFVRCSVSHNFLVKLLYCNTHSS